MTGLTESVATNRLSGSGDETEYGYTTDGMKLWTIHRTVPGTLSKESIEEPKVYPLRFPFHPTVAVHSRLLAEFRYKTCNEKDLSKLNISSNY